MGSRVGFIGAGNMAGAIIEGMLSSGKYCANSLYVFDIDHEKMKNMVSLGLNSCKDINELCSKSEIVFIAVKPQNYNTVLEEMRENEKLAAIVSIAAGVSISYIEQKLNSSNIPIIRVMPNTPILIKKGATAICKSNNTPDNLFNQVYEIFNNLGVVELISEAQMNSIVAVNGSSPAYIYLFIKAMVDFAIKHGIDYVTATNLICKTVEGSANMILESEKAIDELIDAVSSPGGTTVEALKALKDQKFEDIILKAMEKCSNRADELCK